MQIQQQLTPLKFTKQFNQLLQKHKQLQMSLCTQWDRTKYYAKKRLQNVCQNDKDSILQQRVLKYFNINYQIDLRSFFNQKIEANQQSQFNGQQIMLYGVDFMSTRKILRYFQYFNPKEIKWINDSNCILQFMNSTLTKNAIICNLRQKQVFLQNYEKQQLGRMDNDYTHINLDSKCWYEILPYYEFGFQRRLFVRYANKQEANKTFQKSESKFYKYERAKKDFLRSKFPLSIDPTVTNNQHNSEKYSNNQVINKKKKRVYQQKCKEIGIQTTSQNFYEIDMECRSNYSERLNPQLKLQNFDQIEINNQILLKKKFQQLSLCQSAVKIQHQTPILSVSSANRMIPQKKNTLITQIQYPDMKKYRMKKPQIIVIDD